MGDGYGEGRVQLSYGVHRPADHAPLTGLVVSGQQFTGLSVMTFASGDYDGGEMLVLTGTNAGGRYHIVSNTTTTITFEDDISSGFAATDRVCFINNRKRPASTALFFGVKDEFPYPDPEHEYEPHYLHGDGQFPTRHQLKKTSYGPVDIPILLQTARILALCLGKVTTVASAFTGGSTTLSAAAKKGDVYLSVVSTAGFVANDEIEAGGDDTNPQCRTILSVGATIVLNRPLDHDVANGKTVKEVNTATNTYTHTLTESSDGRMPIFCLEGVYDESTDLVRHAIGCVVDKWTMQSSEDEIVVVTPSVAPLNVVKNATTKSSVTVVTTEPFHFRMTGAGTGASLGLVMNGISFLKVLEVSLSSSIAAARNWYHQNTSGQKPFEHTLGRQTPALSVKIVPRANDQLWDLLNDRTSFTTTLNMARTAATDEFTITLLNCLIQKAPHGFPAGDQVAVDVEVVWDNISIAVKNSIADMLA